MASTPELIEEINALFSWNPPRLIPDPNKGPSTRPPSFYDKHFPNHYILKKVERLPSLVQDLAKNVDKALTAASKTLPPLDDFITARQRRVEVRRLAEVVTDEKAVADFYHQTTAKYCSNVASTLALHPTASFSDWDSLLIWTKSGPSAGYAIMDGMLCFVPEGVNQKTETQLAAIAGSMESEKRRIYEDMRKSRSPFATWEIKSTSAGPVEVMTAVPNLGTFSWTSCAAPNCLRDPKHKKARENVKRIVVGPDARSPPWSFPDDTLNTSLVPGSRDEEIGTQPPPHIDASSATLQRPVTRAAAKSGFSMLLPPLSSTSRPPKHGSPKDKGKKRKLDDDGEREEEEEAYKDRHDLTAQSLVQQAWAQAVRVDGTVIVLHSGNHELVCLRHRASQTLYVSNIIEPFKCVDPGYGKLHVGIYIAAIQETMDRLSQPTPPSDGGDKDQDDQDDTRGSGSGRKGGRGRRGGGPRGGRGVRKRGRFQGSEGRKSSTDDELVDIEKTIYVANHRDVVLLYLQYDVYDSPVPASFLRSAPSIMAHTRRPTPSFSPQAVRTCGLEECLTIVLTSEIGRGATGVVHRGTLKPEIWDGTKPLDVVVKLAFDNEQRDALKGEYEVYRRLQSNGVHQGIATALGLFDDSEGAARALVMLYAGVPLCEKSQGKLSISDCNSALSTLESIHLAGILHGDIRRENILVGDLGVTIIDFGHSEQCDDQGAKGKESALLCYCLGLAGKSRRHQNTVEARAKLRK